MTKGDSQTGTSKRVEKPEMIHPVRKDQNRIPQTARLRDADLLIPTFTGLQSIISLGIHPLAISLT